jgi:hypothetical protein
MSLASSRSRNEVRVSVSVAMRAVVDLDGTDLTGRRDLAGGLADGFNRDLDTEPERLAQHLAQLLGLIGSLADGLHVELVEPGLHVVDQLRDLRR